MLEGTPGRRRLQKNPVIRGEISNGILEKKKHFGRNPINKTHKISSEIMEDTNEEYLRIIPEGLEVFQKIICKRILKGLRNGIPGGINEGILREISVGKPGHISEGSK